MDAGSASERAIGGDGQDVNAYVWAKDGASMTEVVQGGADTCWIDASISAAAQQGINLADRITYQGNGYYRVQRFQFEDTDGGDRLKSKMRSHVETVLDGKHLFQRCRRNDGLQNYPQLDAVLAGGSATTVSGNISSTPNTTLELDEASCGK